jgi:beta-glucuronidase
VVLNPAAVAQAAMQNLPGRDITSPNGQWEAIIDPVDFGAGSWSAIWKDRTPQGKTDFSEYSFEDGPVLDVPGDFNSQRPELTFFEGTVWDKKTFA